MVWQDSLVIQAGDVSAQPHFELNCGGTALPSWGRAIYAKPIARQGNKSLSS